MFQGLRTVLRRWQAQQRVAKHQRRRHALLMRTIALDVRRLSAWPMYEAAAALEDGMLWHIYTAHAKVDWGTAQDTCSHCASLLSLCSAAVNFGYGMARAAPDTLPWRDSRSGAVSEARGQYPC